MLKCWSCWMILLKFSEKAFIWNTVVFCSFSQIPLSGYGGTSNIILESVKKLSDSYTLTLDGLLPSRLKRVSFCVRNTGSRAAYVKALCFANLQTKTVVDPQVMTVSPEKFILAEGAHEVSILPDYERVVLIKMCLMKASHSFLIEISSNFLKFHLIFQTLVLKWRFFFPNVVCLFYQMITVTWNPMEKERNFLKPKTLLSTICFFCGDEISRQRYRRWDVLCYC